MPPNRLVAQDCVARQSRVKGLGREQGRQQQVPQMLNDPTAGSKGLEKISLAVGVMAK